MIHDLPSDPMTQAHCRCCHYGQHPSGTPSSIAALHELRSEQQSTFRKDGPDLTKMHGLHTLGLVLLPTFVFWVATFSISQNWPSWFDTCPPLDGSSPLQTDGPNPINCAFKDILESQHFLFCVPFLMANLYALIRYRKAPGKLKKFAFGIHALLTLAIRCLSSFSGMMISPSWYFLIWNSNSPGKFLWLILLIGLGSWSWTYLGTYSDVRFKEDTRSIIDEHGATVWNFTSQTNEKLEQTEYQYAPLYHPWQDTVVRLSYIHIVDNLIHVYWLRFSLSNGPYTTYINNSEILTLLLFTEMGIYTYARMASHVVFEVNDDEETCIGMEKSTIITAKKSITRGLFDLRLHNQPSFRHGENLKELCWGLVLCGLVTVFLAIWSPTLWVVFI
jgi:hypothetical protein